MHEDARAHTQNVGDKIHITANGAGGTNAPRNAGKKKTAG